MRSGPSQVHEGEARSPRSKTNRKEIGLPNAQSKSKRFADGVPVPELNKMGTNPSSTPSDSSLAKEPVASEILVGAISKNGPDHENSNRAFALGDDFIPFDLSGSEEEEEETRYNKDRKRNSIKEGKKPERDGELSRREEAARSSKREWDEGKRLDDWDDETRRRSRDGIDRERGASYKRKYDEYQGDDRDRSNRKRVVVPSKKCPWMSNFDVHRCRNVAEVLHLEVESFLEWISPTPAEDETRGLLVKHIAKTLKGPFPDAVVFPFGSYMTKLYLPRGDIDLVVLSNTMAHNDKTRVLHIMASTLKRAGITSHVTIIAKAKVPIIKFISTHGRFQVDISVNQDNGLISGNIITGFLKELVPSSTEKESRALRSLIMITKAFLAQRNLNEVYTGGLGSYSVVCLAVSFLQMHPKIRNGEIDPEKNLGVLVVEFFDLYGNRFNYDNVGISLREGGTYFSKRERGWNVDYKKNMLSIEDPADPSNDISSGSYHFHKVRTAFAGAYNLLTTTLCNHVGILSSRQERTSFRLRQRYEPEDLSVLSTVMGITQETINHRRLVQELYDKRVLHRILGVEHPKSVKQHSEIDSGRQAAPSSRFMEQAWRHEQRTDDSEDEGDYHRQVRSNDQDGGRYDIGRHAPSKKRQKTQRSEDHHVYFVADGDSRGELSEGEIEGYHDDTANGQINRDRRRHFWLGKAIEVGGPLEK